MSTISVILQCPAFTRLIEDLDDSLTFIKVKKNPRMQDLLDSLETEENSKREKVIQDSVDNFCLSSEFAALNTDEKKTAAKVRFAFLTEMQLMRTDFKRVLETHSAHEDVLFLKDGTGAFVKGLWKERLFFGKYKCGVISLESKREFLKKIDLNENYRIMQICSSLSDKNQISSEDNPEGAAAKLCLETLDRHVISCLKKEKIPLTTENNLDPRSDPEQLKKLGPNFAFTFLKYLGDAYKFTKINRILIVKYLDFSKPMIKQEGEFSKQRSLTVRQRSAEEIRSSLETTKKELSELFKKNIGKVNTEEEKKKVKGEPPVANICLNFWFLSQTLKSIHKLVESESSSFIKVPTPSKKTDKDSFTDFKEQIRLIIEISDLVMIYFKIALE